jgi:hypothetical protein
MQHLATRRNQISLDSSHNEEPELDVLDNLELPTLALLVAFATGISGIVTTITFPALALARMA